MAKLYDARSENGKTYCKLTYRQVQDLVQSGALTSDGHLRESGTEHWIPCSRVPGFDAPALTPASTTQEQHPAGDAAGDEPPGKSTPGLWNPNAAACWSLVFSPILGAWLHAKNWRALNQPAKAGTSMLWVYASVVVALILLVGEIAIIASGKSARWLLGPVLVWLFIWYFCSAKAQMKYVATNEIHYEKRGWLLPLLLSTFIGFLVWLIEIRILILITT